MPDSQTLIPLFVPALAKILAMAEDQKGLPLTAKEAESVRDKSACIMMQSADAEKMAVSRGYADVNPNSCWADWHRLRVQMTGKGYLPKIILCIPGDSNLRARCEPILKEAQIEHEFRAYDQNMMLAFKSSSVTWPSFSADDYLRIDGHATVLYALSKNFVAAEAAAIGRKFLNLGRRLLDAGGIAIKSESSGIAHPYARWCQLDDKANGDAGDEWWALLHAFVVYPIASQTDFYSCGMHLLGAPDLIISQGTIPHSTNAGESTTSAAIELFRTFAMYLLSECSVGNFVSGHTFSVDNASPRYRVVWEPCLGFAEDNFFFNSFGRWRFTLA